MAIMMISEDHNSSSQIGAQQFLVLHAVFNELLFMWHQIQSLLSEPGLKKTGIQAGYSHMCRATLKYNHMIIYWERWLF